jgi:DNA processing protein
MMDSSSKVQFLLRLHFAPGIGRVHQRRLLEKQEIPDRLSIGLRDPKIIERAEREGEWLKKNQAKVISVFDPEYPPLLRHIYDPPTILFFRGNFKEWDSYLPLAFVGTRNPTDYGQKVVEALIEGLAGTSTLIVSGFARGIDTFVHRAALRAGLPTLGVLGTGLDYIYPRENKSLYYQMIENGGFVTEYSTETEPHPGHFPERNRIISGISKTVVLIETPAESGALITAEFAMEQGREVMVVPGNIFSPKNRGCHRLIQQGAKLLGGLEDLLEELKIQKPMTFVSESDRSENNKGKDLEIPKDLDFSERNLFEKLSREPLHIDKITQISNLAPSLVAGTLTTLVLKGCVEEFPGKFFART